MWQDAFSALPSTNVSNRLFLNENHPEHRGRMRGGHHSPLDRLSSVIGNHAKPASPHRERANKVMFTSEVEGDVKKKNGLTPWQREGVAQQQQ